MNYKVYLCTNTDFVELDKIDKCVEEAILGGVTIVQVREKNKTTEEFVEIAKRIKVVTDKYNIPLIINDNVEVAKIINASGVHLGQDDMSIDEARKIIGEDKIIGITVTNVEEAIEAKNNNATYIGVGAIFKSSTKPDAKVVGLEELDNIRNSTSLPLVVIGGINKNTIPLFKNKGVDGYAMIKPILVNDDIRKSTHNLLELINQN